MVPEINLLPNSKRKKSSNKWVLLIAATIFGLVLIFFVLQFILLSKTVNTLQSEEQQLLSKKVLLEENIIELAEPEGMNLELVVTMIEGLSYPVSPLLVEIDKLNERHAYLREYSFFEGSIGFTVDYETIPEVATYIEALQGSPYFSDVLVKEMAVFDPSTHVYKKGETMFDVSDRYGNQLEVLIDAHYLKTGGVK